MLKILVLFLELHRGSNDLLSIIAFVIIIAIGLLIFFGSEKYSLKRKAYQMILAGGIGNLIDRIIRGYVIDYVYIKPFGACNFADFIIVFGAILMLFEGLYELKNGRGRNEDRREL